MPLFSRMPRPPTLPEAWALLAEQAQTIARLERENAALRAEVSTLRTEVETLRSLVGLLQAQVQELTARLHQTSANSSRPPSSDPPQAPSRPARTPTGRPRGGQPGHPGHQRSLVPPERVDHVQEHWPAVCAHCQAPLAAAPAEEVGEPVRHQVTDVPPVRAVVTEHRLHRVRCPACGEETRAALPPAVPTGAFGPRLQAVVALLSGRYRLSRREVAAISDEVLGVPLAVGSVDHLCQATATALAAPVAEVEAAIQGAPVAHADETGWTEASQRRWLWVVVTAVATVFHLASSRGSGVIKALLGETFAGYLVSDRWSASTWMAVVRRQICWAHLKRDFQALVDWGGAARPIGEAALLLIDRLFDAWYHARDDPVARQALPETVRPVQDEFRTLLETGTAVPAGKTAGLCRALLKLWPALWTFVTVPGVEPTNNTAERALRPAVLWRKGSFGTQSPSGNDFVARLLTVTATCRQQNRNLLEYLTAACTAAQSGHPIPSLLPVTPSPGGD